MGIGQAIRVLTNTPPRRLPGGGGPPAVPPRGGPPAAPAGGVPPKGGDLTVPPRGGPLSVPPARSLTPPDAPSAGGGGWSNAAKIAGAIATGGGIIGLINAMSGDDDAPQQPAADPAPGQPPAPTTRADLVNAGYRDYGSGLVPPGGQALGVPEHYRRRMWLKDQSRKYGAEFAKNPKLYSDMVAAYDQAQLGPGSAHSSRAVAAADLTDHLDAQKVGQIEVNRQNAASQQNVARQMGVPRGMVMAMQDVQRHAARGDMASASAAAAMYGQVYGPAFANAATNVTAQHVASERAKGELARQKPPTPSITDSVKENTDQIAAMPAGVGRKAAIEQFYNAANKGDAKAAKSQIENHYQPIIREMGSRLDKLSPEETVELQQVAGHMDYAQFLKYAGVTDTPEAQRSFQRIFTKNASWAQFGDNYGVGNLIRGITPWAD